MTNSKPHWNKRVKKSSTVRLSGILASLIPALLIQQDALAGPEEDRQAFVAFFQARFPNIPLAEFANGIYAIDNDAREQWLDIEDFPPYEFTIDAGEALWQETFASGRTYTDCFADPTEDIRPRYPQFDAASGEVLTLELAINNCRSTHDQPAFANDSTEITAITAYLAFESRGKQLDIRVPADSPGALDAYETGKQARPVEFFLLRLSRHLIWSICSGRPFEHRPRSSHALSRLPFQSGWHGFSSSAIFRLRTRRPGQTVRAAEHRIQKSGVLSGLYEQRFRSQRPGLAQVGLTPPATAASIATRQSSPL